MTATDRKVARVLLSHYPLAGLQTLAEVSEKAGISAPSIIRCVKKLGFAGYPQYQKALHAEMGDMLAERTPEESVSDNWHLPERVRKQYAELGCAIQQTFSFLHEAELFGAATSCLIEVLLAEIQRVIGKPADERLRQLQEARI